MIKLIYNVNGIGFKIDFGKVIPKLNLEKYKTSKKDYQHLFKIDFKADIKIELSLGKVSPFIYKDKGTVYKYFHYKTDILAVIEHDENFRKITITLNERLAQEKWEISYSFLSIMFIEVAMSYGYLAIHASAIKYQDKVFLLSGPSGVGKSTLRSNLLKLDDSLVIINDDKPLLEFGVFISVFGSPFSGEYYFDSNTKEKLTHIFFLKQGPVNKKHLLNEDEKLKHLLKNIYKPKADNLWDTTLSNLEKLAKKINICLVEVTDNISAASFMMKLMEEL